MVEIVLKLGMRRIMLFFTIRIRPNSLQNWSNTEYRVNRRKKIHLAFILNPPSEMANTHLNPNVGSIDHYLTILLNFQYKMYSDEFFFHDLYK